MRIGLTGGIGSGKSTVAGDAREPRRVVIDTDLIARRLTLPGGAAIDAIRAAFGADFIAADGAPRPAAHARGRVRRPRRAARLEAILHPLIGREVEREAARRGRAGARLRRAAAGRVRPLAQPRRRGLVVDCDEAVQIERVARPPGLEPRTPRARSSRSRHPRAQRRAAADAVIHNEGISLAELAAKSTRSGGTRSRRDMTARRRGAGSL